MWKEAVNIFICNTILDFTENDWVNPKKNCSHDVWSRTRGLQSKIQALTAHQRCLAWMGNISSTKQKHSLICVFLLQSDAERPDPGRVSPLLLLPSQHKQELTILAGTAGCLHCRRTGESPSNDRKEVHSCRYCSQPLNWVWQRSRFLVMFKTSNNRDGSAYSFTRSYFESYYSTSISVSSRPNGYKFCLAFGSFRLQVSSRLSAILIQKFVIFSISSTYIPG